MNDVDKQILINFAVIFGIKLGALLLIRKVAQHIDAATLPDVPVVRSMLVHKNSDIVGPHLNFVKR